MGAREASERPVYGVDREEEGASGGIRQIDPGEETKVPASDWLEYPLPRSNTSRLTDRPGGSGPTSSLCEP
jgi:hypothetical protein